jgi:hypothetical protein
MLDPLAFKAVSYGFILLLALIALFLSLDSLKREYIGDKPMSGLLPLILIIAGLCGIISALTVLVVVQRPVSVLLKWESTAITSKEWTDAGN